MPKVCSTCRIPKLCRHKGTNQGYVRLSGKMIYLGPYGVAETKANYERTVAEWLTAGRTLPVAPEDLTCAELAARFLAWAENEHGSDAWIIPAIRRVLRDDFEPGYGATAAAEFGPVALRGLRHRWVEAGLSHRTIRLYVQIIQRMFRYGASHELLPASVYDAIKTLEPLRAGRHGVRPRDPVRPVALEDVERAKAFMPAPLRAMVDLQLLTGGRPGEVCALRPCDIDQAGDVWRACLEKHKGAWRGQTRTLYFGPKAQELLKPFLLRPADAFLFSPKEAMAERHATAPTHRRQGQQPNERLTDRTLGDRYTVDSYRRAISYACRAARVSWTPHQLRHTAGTQIRQEFGLDGAQVVLGHQHADVTQVYAEVSEAKAKEIARRRG